MESNIRARRTRLLASAGAALLAWTLAMPATVQTESGDIALFGHALDFAAQQLGAATQSLSTDEYPDTTGSSGAWSTDDASAWTSGFFPGLLWLMVEREGTSWQPDAEAWLEELEGEKNDTSTHDVGFKIFPSFGNAYRLTQYQPYRNVVLTAAGSLSTRYSATVGAIKSWDGPTSSDFRVIIDNMMNLEILFWGARNGGNPAWYTQAVNHALTTREHHVRADGSTYQVVDFNPATGDVKWKDTNQGFDAESTWSRGQAWAVYGFTMTYRETGDSRFLDTARLTADYFINHLPPDGVPYWDFELPSTSGQPRDSSAAAIAASGLIELSELDPDPARAQFYHDHARAILVSLASPAYLAEGTNSAAVLLHATQNYNNDRYDTGLIYGDYYFVEALLRYLRAFGAAPSASDVTAQTLVDAAVQVHLSGTDAQECELAFSIVTSPAHGTVQPIEDETCAAGVPNHDTASVTYVPYPGFSGSDTFTYRVNDGVNDSNTATVKVTVVPSGGGGETLFTTVADAKVKSTSPSSNYGTETDLRLRAPDPAWRTLVKFDVSGITGAVTQATLRLYVTGASNDGGSVYPIASTWTETHVTWSNAPAFGAGPLDSAGPVAAGAWIEYDVTSAVPGNGTVSFGLSSQSTSSCYFSSREGGHAPELLVRTGGGTPPDTTPPTVVNRVPAAGASNVAVDAVVTATFDEDVLGVSGTTFTLRQGATAVAASVTYNASTRTATLDPAASLAAGTLYTAALAAGITDDASPPNALVPLSWTFTTAAIGPPVATTFTTVADAKVKSTSPSSNYGTETDLRLRAPDPAWRTLVKFDVSGITGAVTQATLRLYVTGASNDGGFVYPIASTWTETGVTWRNAPAFGTGAALAAAGRVTAGTWVEFDVTAAVTGNGIVSFGVLSQSTTSCYFSSREGAHPPQLVVRTGGAP